MSEEEILSKRAALAELRQTLEARSRDVLERALDLNPFE